MKHQRTPSAKVLRTVNESVTKQLTVLDLEPSEFYDHEMKKFRTKHSGSVDKVKTYNETSNFWKSTPFL